jgi:hypothetical protein
VSAAGGVPLASLGSAFDDYIVDAGKLPAFLFLCAFLGGFGYIRTSAHMIRAQVSWWPGNVEVGGTHIHHLVWGIITLIITGWISIALDPGSPGPEILAVLFGIGTGLTLDEFALWLDLKDVYWSEQGRKSIDAVIVAAIIAGFGVLGISVWVDAADETFRAIHAVVGFFGLLGLVFAAVNFAKEKFAMGAVGLFIWPVALVGALRLGRPGSPWSRLFYKDERRRRAGERFGEHVPDDHGQQPSSPLRPEDHSLSSSHR